jgi:hypothetical protein
MGPPSQVFIPLASNVTFGSDVNLSCPLGLRFIDGFNGEYDSGSYLVPSQNCDSQGQGLVRVSTLSFQCVACGEGQYSLDQARSTGQPGNVSKFGCLQCPVGGVCHGGTIVASPGYWGSTLPWAPTEVQFAVGPDGYCCGGRTPCMAINTCAGHRHGPLCSECLPGYTEGVGDAWCVPKTQCGNDKGKFWALALTAMLLDASLQLTLVSDVWRPSNNAPDGMVQYFIYYMQVSSCVMSSHLCYSCRSL